MPRQPKKHKGQRKVVQAVTAARHHQSVPYLQPADALQPGHTSLPGPRPPNSTSSLPGELSELIENALQLSLAKSTRKNYESSLRRFEVFCDTYHIPQNRCFPTNERILCAFTGSHDGNSAGGTAANRILALKTLHALMGLPWKGGIHLSYVIRGVANATPTSSTRPIRPPVTTYMLQLLHSYLDLDSPFDAVVFALALVAFWGQCCTGELVAHSQRNISSPLLPLIKSISRNPTAGNARELHLPHTKTSQHLGKRIILTRHEGPLDPIQAITRLIRLNRYPEPNTNLFTYRHGPKGALKAITKEEFLRRCNDIWSAHGIQCITGHSFRYGGTSELLEQGVPPKVVKEMGRWKSEAFYRYWRGLGSIAAKHVEQARAKRTGANSWPTALPSDVRQRR